MKRWIRCNTCFYTGALYLLDGIRPRLYNDSNKNEHHCLWGRNKFWHTNNQSALFSIYLVGSFMKRDVIHTNLRPPTCWTLNNERSKVLNSTYLGKFQFINSMIGALSTCPIRHEILVVWMSMTDGTDCSSKSGQSRCAMNRVPF